MGVRVTIQEYLRVLRGHWIIVVSVALIVMIGAGVAWWLRPPDYTAHLTMYVSAQATDTANAAYQGGACCPSSGCRPTSGWSAAPG